MNYVKMPTTSMDLPENCQRNSQQQEATALKPMLNLLLHFKYMLDFMFKHFPSEFDHLKLAQIAPEFHADFKHCSEQFAHLLAKSADSSHQLIRKQEQFYQCIERYCPFSSWQYLSNSSSTFDHDDNNQQEISDKSFDNENAQVNSNLMENQKLPDSVPNFENNSLNNSTICFSDHTFHDQFSPGSTFSQDVVIPMPSSSNISNKCQHENITDCMLSDEMSNEDSSLLELLPQLDPNLKHKEPTIPTKIESEPMDIQDPTKESKDSDKPATELPAPEESQEPNPQIENDILQVEYWCSFENCRFRSKSLTQVKEHEERRHVQPVVNCIQDGCGSIFQTKQDLDSHLTSLHAASLFKCALEVCAKEFNSDYRFKQHVREEHKEEYRTCKLCNKKFKTRKYLMKHLRNLHPKEAEEQVVDQIIDSTINCTIDNCDKKFMKRLKLRQHLKEQHAEVYLTCKFCDKQCKTRNNLTNHIWIMHEEGDFRCTFEQCDFSSRFRKNLLSHKKLRHQTARKCAINDCGEMIPITRYQRHMSSLHKIKNYPCSWPDCGKTFADHNALKNHVRIHLNFKRYRCKWPECGYASEQRFTVITHIRVCHFKLPRTKKKQKELNISPDEQQNPYEYLEVCREDICI